MAVTETSASTVALQLGEAVELCTAWMQSLATARGIRLLVLKGDALARQNLRGPHVSSDVDVLIEPTRLNEYVSAVIEAGWSEFEVSFATEQFTLHSRTLKRDGWPNSVDIHAYWPGFLATPQDAFDALWERREQMRFAHQCCAVPDRLTHALMLALHSLRGTPSHPRHQMELESVLGLDLSEQELRDAASLIHATGSAVPLRDVILRLGIRVDVSAEEYNSPGSREWRRKVDETQGRVAYWLEGLRSTPWRNKPRMLWQALWPTNRDILLEHPEVVDSALPMLRARLGRLRRGIAQLPRVIPRGRAR